jgi:hypothetical protein
MAATISRGYTFGATETVTNAKLHALVDDASISGIIDSDIAAGANIDSAKINFDLSDYVTLAGDQTVTGNKTFSGTSTFSTVLTNQNLAPIATASYVSGLSFYALASCTSGVGKLPLANVPTIDSLLPAQGSASGQFLTTNGSVSSWAALTQQLKLTSTTTITNTNPSGWVTIEKTKNYKIIFVGDGAAHNSDWYIETNGSGYLFSLTGSQVAPLPIATAGANNLVSCYCSLDLLKQTNTSSNTAFWISPVSGFGVGFVGSYSRIVADTINSLITSSVNDVTAFRIGRGANFTGTIWLYEIVQ